MDLLNRINNEFKGSKIKSKYNKLYDFYQLLRTIERKILIF